VQRATLSCSSHAGQQSMIQDTQHPWYKKDTVNTQVSGIEMNTRSSRRLWAAYFCQNCHTKPMRPSHDRAFGTLVENAGVHALDLREEVLGRAVAAQQRGEVADVFEHRRRDPALLRHLWVA